MRRNTNSDIFKTLDQVEIVVEQQMRVPYRWVSCHRTTMVLRII